MNFIHKNKIFIFLAGVVLLTILIITLFYFLVLKQNNRTLTYENSRFGFKVDYPNDWQLGQEPANSDGREISSPDNQVVCRAYGFNNSLSNDSGQPQTTNQYVDWVIETENQASENKNFKLVERTETKLDDNKAVRLEFENNGKITDSIYSLNTEIGFGLSCEYDSSDQKQKYQDDYDLMRESFKVKQNFNQKPLVNVFGEMIMK